MVTLKVTKSKSHIVITFGNTKNGFSKYMEDTIEAVFRIFTSSNKVVKVVKDVNKDMRKNYSILGTYFLN